MIVFDMDNTINDWTANVYYRLVARESMAELETVHHFIRPLLDRLDKGGITLSQFENRIARRFKVPKARINYFKCYKKTVHVRPGMIRLVKHLKQRYQMALMTNSERTRYAYTAKTINLKIFDYTFVSEYTHLIKPNMNAYANVIKKTGTMPSEMLLIDDKMENVIVARRAGMKAIRFVGERELRQQLERMDIL